MIAQVSADGEFFLHLSPDEVEEASRIWASSLDDDGQLDGLAFYEALKERGNLPHFGVLPEIVHKVLAEVDP